MHGSTGDLCKERAGLMNSTNRGCVMAGFIVQTDGAVFIHGAGAGHENGHAGIIELHEGLEPLFELIKGIQASRVFLLHEFRVEGSKFVKEGIAACLFKNSLENTEGVFVARIALYHIDMLLIIVFEQNELEPLVVCGLKLEKSFHRVLCEFKGLIRRIDNVRADCFIEELLPGGTAFDSILTMSLQITEIGVNQLSALKLDESFLLSSLCHLPIGIAEYSTKECLNHVQGAFPSVNAPCSTVSNN